MAKDITRLSGVNHVLILIDGHAILHRAYHALPPLTILDRPSRNML